MAHVPIILLGLIGQILLPYAGIALRVEPANDCLDAVPGDSCHKFVTWCLDTGLEKHPEWFPSFRRSGSEEHNFKQIQGILYSRNKAGCGRPCLAEPATASPPDAEVQKNAALAAFSEEAKHVLARPCARAGAPLSSRMPCWRAPAPAAQEASPIAPSPAAEGATSEAAPATLAEETKPADGPAPAAQKQPLRSNLIGKLEAEVKALDAMSGSPSLETSRAEKRQLIRNLQTADELEAEFKARQLQNLRTLNKLEAELEELEAMEDTPALEVLRAEKRTQIQKQQTADTLEANVTTRELQRLQDLEAAPAAPAAEKANPEEQPPRSNRSNLIDKLEAEVNAVDLMKDSPALDTLRAEKRQLIHNLQTADELETKLKARQFQNLQTLNKLEAELKVLEAMDSSLALEALREEKNTQIHNLQSAEKLHAEVTMQEIYRLQDPTVAAEEVAPAAPAAENMEPGRQLWWQRKWREAKAKAVAVVVEAKVVFES